MWKKEVLASENLGKNKDFGIRIYISNVYGHDYAYENNQQQQQQ
jgi:hypothetical protein